MLGGAIPRIGAYAGGAAGNAEATLLKLFRDKSLFWGQMLSDTLVGGGGARVVQAEITIANIQDFTGHEDLELSKNKYNLLTMMAMDNNPYHIARDDLILVKRKINVIRARAPHALPPLNIVNTAEFTDFIQDIDAGTAGLLNDVMNEIVPDLKRSGKDQTKKALAYLTKATPQPTVSGVVGAFGAIWKEGEEEAQKQEKERVAAAKAQLDVTDPGRELQGSELNKCGALYKQLLEQNLKLLMEKYPRVAVRYNDIIRRAINAGGADLDRKLRTALRHVAISLKQIGLTTQANSLLASLYDDVQLRKKVAAKDDAADAEPFFQTIKNRLRLRVGEFFGHLPADTPFTNETERLRLYIEGHANQVNQARVTALVDDLDAHPGDARANVNQYRLTRRVQKYLADQEIYLAEARFAAEVPDAADPIRLNFLYDRAVRSHQKFRARIEGADPDTYFVTPALGM